MGEYISPLTVDNFPDKQWKPDGYDFKEVPRATEENFAVLIKMVNKLIVFHNEQLAETEAYATDI